MSSMPVSAPLRPQHRYQFSLRALLVFVLICALLAGYVASQRERVEHPETGYDFPPIDQIKAFRLKYEPSTSAALVTAEIPLADGQEIMKALSPSEVDPHPLTWA